MSTEPDPNAPPPETTAAAPEPPVPETPAPETPESQLQAAAARIAALEAELAEMKDRWIRSEAEMANLRARSRREVDDTRQYAVQSFAKDVVEAAENLRRGLAALPAAKDDEPDIIGRMRAGFEGVERGFVSLLERHGITSQDPTGTPFDPNLHQAMAEQESAVHPPGTVTQAWTAAWTLHGRLLRPAMVVVAKAPATEISSRAEDEVAPPPVQPANSNQTA